MKSNSWVAVQISSGTLFFIINTSIYDGPNPTILTWVSISPFWGKASIKHGSESWPWSLGSVESRHAWQFFLFCTVFFCNFQTDLQRGGRSMLLLACAWFHGAGKECQNPIYPPPFPKASSRDNQSFCSFSGGHALYFLFCIPSVLETSLMFVSSLEELKDNTYFILHSYLFGNKLRHRKRKPPPLQAAP